jgi:hypothetical protein
VQFLSGRWASQGSNNHAAAKDIDRCRPLVVLLAACLGSSAEPVPSDDDLRILFIGNSLTSANDLPGLVGRLGQAVEGKAPIVESVTVGGFSLEDHWNRGDAQKAIGRDKWDLVVLQQGPSALPESRVLLVEYTRRFAEEIRRTGGRPALYMVWPPASRAVLRRNPDLALFAGDGFHPSGAGTYLAALVIYAQASNRSPIGISAVARIANLPPGDIEVLEAGASEAIDRFSPP